MENVAAVIVEGENRTIGIPAVTYVPLLDLATGRIHTELIELRAGFRQQTLDRRGEEKPIGVWRVDPAHTLELMDITLFGDIVERHPQGIPSTEERFGDIGGIHQILPSLAPTEIVGRVWIDRISIGCESPFTKLSALLAFGGVVIGQRQPGSDTCHQTSEGLHINHRAVAVVERR